MFRVTEKARTLATKQRPVVSSAGDVRVDVIFESSREDGEVLRKDGYVWDKDARVMVRVVAGNDATVADLLRTDGLRIARNSSTETVLTSRAYLPQDAFREVNAACADGGFANRPRIGWAKRTSEKEHAALVAMAGALSEERKERTRREEAAAKEDEAREAAREAAQESRTAARQRAESDDVTYKRRLYAYGQLLLRMQRTETVSYGGDGAPCWPDPPKPGEQGIVSDATTYLMASEEEMRRAERAMARRFGR